MGKLLALAKIKFSKGREGREEKWRILKTIHSYIILGSIVWGLDPKSYPLPEPGGVVCRVRVDVKLWGISDLNRLNKTIGFATA